MNLLITSAGRRNQLLDCFRHSATQLGIPLRILTTDMRPGLSSASLAADASFAVPPSTSPSYIPALLEICSREKVSLLIPTIDHDLAPLSESKDKFAAIGTTVIISSYVAVHIARDKFATIRALGDVGIPVPKSLMLKDYLAEPTKLAGDLIAKPRAGSSSIGIILPRGPADLANLPPDDYVVQEKWEGQEFTVNVFIDRAGKLISAIPHLRMQVRSGEVSQGLTVRNAALSWVAERLTLALPGLRGPACFQAIVRADGSLCVFEVNARFGGGYPLADEAGARFVTWLLEEQAGLPSSATSAWEEGVLMLRHDAASYVRTLHG